MYVYYRFVPSVSPSRWDVWVSPVEDMCLRLVRGMDVCDSVVCVPVPVGCVGFFFVVYGVLTVEVMCLRLVRGVGWDVGKP